MADTSVQVQQPSRSRDLDKLLLRPGNLVGPRFEPGAEVLSSLIGFCFRVLSCKFHDSGSVVIVVVVVVER